MQQTTMDTHDTFLHRAIALAVRARREGRGPFGAIIVSANGEVLFEAENLVRNEQDFTAHAEMVGLREVGRRHGLDALVGTTMYASGEPCAMCSGAILYFGLKRLVYGLGIPRQLELRNRHTLRRQIPCRQILVVGPDPVDVIGPLHEEAAEAPFRVAP
jgi:tRNA(Arg) A34 adenosine deaminase TadA